MWAVVNFLPEHLEVLVFDDAGERDFPLGVVNNGVTLVVGDSKVFLLEAHGAVFEFAEAVAEIFIDFSREHDVPGDTSPIYAVVKEICASLCFHSIEQPRNQSIVPSDGDALVTVVEVIVVVY